MSDAEVITILICFHFNSYRYFKHYYLGCVCIHWKHLFPHTFSYNRFMEIMPRCFVALTMFLRLACFGECTGISFVDSTCIPVIHNKRQFNMKVCTVIEQSFCAILRKPLGLMGFIIIISAHVPARSSAGGSLKICAWIYLFPSTSEKTLKFQAGKFSSLRLTLERAGTGWEGKLQPG